MSRFGNAGTEILPWGIQKGYDLKMSTAIGYPFAHMRSDGEGHVQRAHELTEIRTSE